LASSANHSTTTTTGTTIPKQWSFAHSHNQCTSLKRQIFEVVYPFDTPTEVALSLRKDMSMPGGLAGAGAHSKHLGCSKKTVDLFHGVKDKRREAKRVSEISAAMLQRDVYGIEDHVLGCLHSQKEFNVVSVHFSQFKTAETARVMAAVYNFPEGAFRKGWAAADAVDQQHSEKVYTGAHQKVPRGARLQNLGIDEQHQVNATFGAANQEVAAFPQLCVWPKVPRAPAYRRGLPGGAPRC
jgi:hypothetical protein